MEMQFRLFGIPVQVSLFFFLIVVLLRPGGGDHPALAVAWVAVAFAGVLLHELGHALTARAFGQAPRIALHGMGGVTFWRQRGPLSPAKRIATSAAGPGVGLALGLTAWVAGIATGLGTDTGPAGVVLGYFVWVNLGWGVFNLVPMLPLDGGAIMAAGLEGLFGTGGRRAARYLSMVVALGVAALAVTAGAFIAAALCALFVYTNVQGLRAEGAGEAAVAAAPPDPPPPPGRDPP
ncbi:MAG TPA: site-2 protease family protein [Vicinamibacteria bacterium]|nr:site-2 protease family protein [Vicinamibacteria bacterium]